MDKIKIFEKEINYLKIDKYKENLKIVINLLPDYFFEVPASSTGKYHPSFSLNEGGLLRHTKAAIRIAYELYSTSSVTGNFKDHEKDLMLFALLIHDGFKHGINKSEYVLVDHPLIISNFLKENKNKLTLTDNEINFISNVVESHMGPWTTDYKGNEVLPLPVNKYQKFVHMCDFLSSRKFLDIKFENDEIIF